MFDTSLNFCEVTIAMFSSTNAWECVRDQSRGSLWRQQWTGHNGEAWNLHLFFCDAPVHASYRRDNAHAPCFWTVSSCPDALSKAGVFKFFCQIRGPYVKHLYNSSRACDCDNVIVSGYVTFDQIRKFFVIILLFHYWQNGLPPDEMVSRAGLGDP